VLTVLGIDPGSRITGYGIVKIVGKEIMYVTSGCVRTKKNAISERMQEIYQGISQVVSLYQVDEVAIEQVFFATQCIIGTKIRPSPWSSHGGSHKPRRP